MTPFEAVYGVPPPTLMQYVPCASNLDAVDTYLRDRDSILRDLRNHFLQAKDRMLVQADRHRRDVTFAVGD